VPSVLANTSRPRRRRHAAPRGADELQRGPLDRRPVKRSYRVPAAGWLYITVSALLGIGAINSQNNLLFLIFGLALGAILVSGVVSGSIMMGIRLERLAPSTTRVGDRSRIGYRVRNANRLVPVFAVSITEESLSPRSANGLMPPVEDEPRFFGLFAMRLPPKVPRPHAFLAHLSPRRETEAFTVFTPAKRGALALRRVRVATTFPLGIVEKIVVFEQHDELLVEPEVRHVPRSTLRTLVSVGRFADTASRTKGAGLEFFGLREYAPGDTPRLISWRASARLGTLLTRETAAPTDESFVIELDLTKADLDAGADASLADPLLPVDSDAERTVTLAASLAAAGVRNNMRVGLRCEPLDLDIPPDASARHLVRLLQTLARLARDDAYGHASSTQRHAPRRSSRSDAVVRIAFRARGTTDAANVLSPADLDRIAPPVHESARTLSAPSAAARRDDQADPSHPDAFSQPERTGFRLDAAPERRRPRHSSGTGAGGRA